MSQGKSEILMRNVKHKNRAACIPRDGIWMHRTTHTGMHTHISQYASNSLSHMMVFLCKTMIQQEEEKKENLGST